MKILILQETTHTKLIDCEMPFAPCIGDVIAGINFKDGYSRTIVRRLIFPKAPQYLNVYVEYSYPNLVKLEATELNETEASHALILNDKIS